ncbi:MAG: phage holin family protein [Promicromonosporaceae bacterium]|nr:phage holin family protein [Promicromonosporaceae bacterium]
MNFVLRTLVTALVLWLTSLILPNRVNIMDNGEAWGTLLAVLLIALIFNAIHSVIKPIVKTLTGCLYLLTLGLFSLVVNALMLWLTTWITGHDGWLSGTD